MSKMYNVFTNYFQHINCYIVEFYGKELKCIHLAGVTSWRIIAYSVDGHRQRNPILWRFVTDMINDSDSMVIFDIFVIVDIFDSIDPTRIDLFQHHVQVLYNSTHSCELISNTIQNNRPKEHH